MANRPIHVTQGSVLDDLGFSSGPAAVLKFKAELYQAILKVAKTYSQKELQRILEEPQPVAQREDRQPKRREVTLLRGPARNRGKGHIRANAQRYKDIVEKELALANWHLASSKEDLKAFLKPYRTKLEPL